MFFYCMKGEYHLELINNCMHLLVGRENDCSGSNIPQNRVFQDWLPHPPLVVWNDLYKDHIWCIYYCNLLPLNKNVSAYEDQNQNGCVIEYVIRQKISFYIFWPFKAKFHLFWLPWQRAKTERTEHSLLKL